MKFGTFLLFWHRLQSKVITFSQDNYPDSVMSLSWTLISLLLFYFGNNKINVDAISIQTGFTENLIYNG